MPTTLTTRATDESTFVITAAFADEDGVAVVPNSASWTLTNDRGGVINGRTAISATPASSIEIVLSGDDLSYTDGAYRILTIQATYDSTLGSNLPLNDQVIFAIDNLVIV